MDLGLSKDEYESYRIFQGRIVDEYESMINDDNFVVIDGTLEIEKQQDMVRRNVLKVLKMNNKLHNKTS
jgi:dTMP kinase